MINISEARKYRLVGSRTPGERIDRILLSGTSSNPENYLELNGGSVELSDEEYKRLNKRYVLHKTSGPAFDESSKPSDSDSESNDLGGE